jgi:heme-degrading monooxygenase HmoA
MKFREVEIESFQQLFEERKHKIRTWPGCLHLELWQDMNDKNLFFTYSHWESEAHLDNYRFSEFFKDTWSRTRVLFADKPDAWSVYRKSVG